MLKKHKKRKLPPVKTNDPFIKVGKRPDYKHLEGLVPYLSDRGKLMPKSRTGLTARSQRWLATAVKRARHLALLPFTERSR